MMMMMMMVMMMTHVKEARSRSRFPCLGDGEKFVVDKRTCFKALLRPARANRARRLAGACDCTLGEAEGRRRRRRGVGVVTVVNNTQDNNKLIITTKRLPVCRSWQNFSATCLLLFENAKRWRWWWWWKNERESKSKGVPPVRLAPCHSSSNYSKISKPFTCLYLLLLLLLKTTSETPIAQWWHTFGGGCILGWMLIIKAKRKYNAGLMRSLL